jgi:hypothetical protein
MLLTTGLQRSTKKSRRSTLTPSHHACHTTNRLQLNFSCQANKRKKQSDLKEQQGAKEQVVANVWQQATTQALHAILNVLQRAAQARDVLEVHPSSHANHVFSQHDTHLYQIAHEGQDKFSAERSKFGAERLELAKIASHEWLELAQIASHERLELTQMTSHERSKLAQMTSHERSELAKIDASVQIATAKIHGDVVVKLIDKVRCF